MTTPVRAALYLRVSTGRQADNDLSIPDQRRQAKAHCASRGWEIVADYVDPGVSATDDRRPGFQRMIDAATTKPPAFDMIVVHSFSRFFRDQFQLEFYVRRLAKNGVRLVSITQEVGDDPMSNMIRQIMALFDEYQSKENAKHTLRAMKENARQGFWNGARPPIGYRIVEAAEQHGVAPSSTPRDTLSSARKDSGTFGGKPAAICAIIKSGNNLDSYLVGSAPPPEKRGKTGILNSAGASGDALSNATYDRQGERYQAQSRLRQWQLRKTSRYIAGYLDGRTALHLRFHPAHRSRVVFLRLQSCSLP